MGWKDTVVWGNKPLIHNEVIKVVECARTLERGKETLGILLTTMLSSTDNIMALSEAQAEISFKAGIREVVEELKKRNVESPVATPTGVHRVPLYAVESWQAKLKEWGIDDNS